MWVDVDTAITVPVNIAPLTDSTDFDTQETGIVYNQAGMALFWNFQTTAGVTTQTAVTPTTAGVYDWTNSGGAMYKIEIPASGGASANNDTEGFGWFTGKCTGVLSWVGPKIGFRAAALNNALIDGGDNLDVNTVQWLGTAAATPTTAGVPEVDVTYISGDSTAADNLELQYDGTGITDDTFPATQAQAGALSSGSAAISIQAESYVLTTGTQSSGTITDSETLNGVYHEHTDTAGVLDLYYQFDVGGNGIAVDANIAARINGSNDSVLIQAYNWAGASWDQIGELIGTNGTGDTMDAYELLLRNTGTGANLGKVRIRFYAASGLTSATLRVDRISAAYSIVSQSVGYALGRIWVNTNDGTSGAVPFFNGVADRSVLTWADALLLSAPSAVNITDFNIINGGSIELSANSDNFSIFGDNYSLALGIQSCVDIHIVGAVVSGIGTAATGSMHFEACEVGAASVQSGHFDFCGFSDTLTMTLAGDYNYHNCYSKVAGASSPTFTKTAGQAITAQWRNWAGGITFSGLEVGDTLTIGGTLGTVDLGSPAGAVAVEIRGTYKAIVNIGSASVNLEGAILGGDVADILVDTGTAIPATIVTVQNDLDIITGAAGALLDTTATSAQLVDDIWDEVISMAAHNVGQSAAKILRQSGDLVQIDGAISDLTPTATNFDTNLTQADTYFDDAVLIFSNGSANAGIGRPVSAYLNAGGNMTFAAPDDWPVTPVDGDDFVVFASHVHPVAQIADAVLDEALSGHATAGTLGKAVTDIEVDTTEIGAAGAGLTDLGGMSTAMKAEINAEMLDVLATDTFAELASVPGATSSLKDKLTWVFMLARNQLEQTSTTATVRADNTTTSVAAATVSDDGSVATRGEFS